MDFNDALVVLKWLICVFLNIFLPKVRTIYEVKIKYKLYISLNIAYLSKYIKQNSKLNSPLNFYIHHKKPKKSLIYFDKWYL